ncbi:hypothetical protein GX563_00295 [Candidatus Bathyarchaeota archaeon]|mgnify:CR=1 FL=1|nr:hypothetical protein [Candidatus Bathyarchaeota archaeon]
MIDEKAARGNIAIVIDSNNLPHIAYLGYQTVHSDSPIDVVYASFNGTIWQTQVVTEGSGKIDLALDSSNNPHITFNDNRNEALMYAQWNGNNWTIQQVDANGRFGSLKLDSKGNPHIAYRVDDVLKYAYFNESNWNTQILDSSRYELLDYQSSLCLDKNDNPHILYGFNTGQTSNSVSTLKYAYLNDYGWKIQTVASNVDIGFGNLALDSYGNPHLTYAKGHPQSTSNHVTITHLSFNGSQWGSDVIANDVMILGYGSAYLTIEANDTVYASYPTYDNSYLVGSLQLAKLTSGMWNTETVVNASTMVGFSPIASDSKGNLHVAYFDVNINSTSHNAYLYYATSTNQLSTIPQSNLFLTALIVLTIATIVSSIVGLLLVSRHRKTSSLKQ